MNHPPDGPDTSLQAAARLGASPADLAALAADLAHERATHPAAQPVRLWPCNLPAFRLWAALRTQVRMGPGGPVGLDYTAIPRVRRAAGLSPRAAERAFPGLQVAEAEWLAVIAERLAEDKSQRERRT